jgi:hypothetical protein
MLSILSQVLYLRSLRPSVGIPGRDDAVNPQAGLPVENWRSRTEDFGVPFER